MKGTHGHGADIVYNTVGSPYFERANHAMPLLRPGSRFPIACP